MLEFDAIAVQAIVGRLTSVSHSRVRMKLAARVLTLLMVWQIVALPAATLAQDLRRKPVPIPAFHDDPSWHTIDYRAPRKPVPTDGSSHSLPKTITLLDGVGGLNRLVRQNEVASWKTELHHKQASSPYSNTRSAELHLWVGEFALAHDSDLRSALWHFNRAISASRGTDAIRGRAVFDTAIVEFLEGRYRTASQHFLAILADRSFRGVPGRDVSLWYGHAKACAGYHAERAANGIPEPAALDPLCGAAALAKCLKELHIGGDRASVLAHMRITGRGSSMRDVMNAANSLGAGADSIKANDAVLKGLPKPIIAFVEHDHFICVTKTSNAGVCYLCSDCGPWPGGEVKLSWKQWRMLDASVLGIVYKRGSETERLIGDSGTGGFDLLASKLVTGATGGIFPQIGALTGRTGDVSRLASLIASHAILQIPGNQQCGYAPSSEKCANFWCCPDDDCPTCNHNPDQGDPLNAATGEEEYTPEPDFNVYNPIGPSVVFSRRYDSLRGRDDAYESDDFGIGWSHNYNVGVIDPNVLQNWLIPQGGSGNIPCGPSSQAPDGYPNFPMSGILWNVDLNGASIASASVPNGWAVALDPANGHLIVRAPAGAVVAENYDARYASQTGGSGGSVIAYGPYFTTFDIIPAGSVAQATDLPANYQSSTYVTVAVSGSDAPGANLTWDIVRNSSVVATSSAPAGWYVTYAAASLNDQGQPIGSGRIQVGAPQSATLGIGYEVRVDPNGLPAGPACAIDAASPPGGGGSGSNCSGTFSIVGPNFQPTAGNKYIFLDNGARIAVTPGGIPTSTQQRISCSVAPGSPYVVEWDYVTGNPLGQYVITLADRTRWTTASYGNVTFNGGVTYSLARVTDRNGNYIELTYGSPGASGFPTLNSISDSNGAALLVFARAGDSSGNVTVITDRYGRNVYYHVSTYPTIGVPPEYPQSQQELDHVSQVVTGNVTNPPDRYVYGYQNVLNGDPNESIPFLHFITSPSPAGSGVATAIINYQPSTCFVLSRVDANGNVRALRSIDQNHTQIQIFNSQATLVFSYTFGFDSNMSMTSVTDGTVDANGHNTQIIYYASYADGSDPYRPSSVLDGNGYAVNGANGKGLYLYSWDQFGHCTKRIAPNGTETDYTWNYTQFPLGELTSAQEGSKCPISVSYYEPSGLLQSVTGPTPGSTGNTSTQTDSFTYDGVGNILTSTQPGNNAAPTLTTTYSYTTDGSYTQPEAIGEPIAISDGLGHTSHFRYSSIGVISSAWDALGNTISIASDAVGNPVQVTLPPTGQSGGGSTTFQYTYQYLDGPLQQTSLYDEGGNLFRHYTTSYGNEGEVLSQSGDQDPVTVAYDAMYRITQMTDGNGNQTRYYYNAAGYPSQVQRANGETLQITSYDPNGDDLSVTNGRNQVINHIYDHPSSLLTDTQYPGSPALNSHFSYDAYERVSGFSDAAGTKSYSYDDLSNVLTETTTYQNIAPLSVSYSRYPDGSRHTMTTPAGTYTYNYDAGQRLVGLTNPYNETSSWAYFDNDWLHTQTLSNGDSSVFTYNALGEMTDESTFDASYNLLSEYGGMHYDAAGNLLSMSTFLSGLPSYSGNTTYQWNNRDELSQESSARLGGYTYNYAWDLAHNATVFRGVSRSFNSANELTTNGYDGDGNAVSFDGLSLSFDPESRVTSVGGTSFVYSGTERASATTGGNTTYSLYSDGVPVAELDSSGNVSTAKTYGVTGLLSTHSGSNSIWTILDPFGSDTQTTDSNGNDVTGSIYDLFGQRSSSAQGTNLDQPYIVVRSAAGNFSGAGGLVYPPGAPPFNPASGLMPTPGYAGGGYSADGGRPDAGGGGQDDDEMGGTLKLGPSTRAGSEIDQGIIGDRRAARGMAHTLSSIMNVIGGAGFIEAFTGQDIWGCPLDGWSRGMSFFNGFGIAGMMGEVEEGGSLAGNLEKTETHHWWPRMFKKWFTSAGMDIEESAEPISRAEHLYLHRGGFQCRGGWLNRAWRDFIEENDPMDEDIVQKVHDLTDELKRSAGRRPPQ